MPISPRYARLLHNVLTSGFTFAEEERHLEYQFRILNSIMLTAALFALLFGLMHDFHINNISNLHAKVDYLYAAFIVLLLWRLRRSRQAMRAVSYALAVASFITFLSALLTVPQDQFRLIWFYFLVYVSFVLLGPRVGMVVTLLSIAAILLAHHLVALQLAETTLFSALVGLAIMALLTRSYTVQMGRYEQLLRGKNRRLEQGLEEVGQARERAEEASRAKSLFLANMSHEIRTPMNGVLGLVQVLQNTPLGEEQRRYLQGIEQSGRNLLSLLDELLDLSRIESGRLTLNLRPFMPHRWLADIELLMAPLFARRGLDFTATVVGELPPWLEGDEARLRQVVVNLLSNAAKFTEQGWVRLTLGGRFEGWQRFRLRLQVADSGIGIPAAQQQAIFDSFRQVNPERIANQGVGLGLAICQRLVAAMGGAITLVSQEGEGSCFTVEVGLAVAPGAVGESAPSPAPYGSARFTVLLVDDDPIGRMAVRALLGQAGHRVVEAADGEEALARLQEQRVDVVLMDVHMPVLDGVTATRCLRTMGGELAALPVIGMTASVMNEEREGYLLAGMDAVVEKPIMLEKLLQVIEQGVAGGGRV